MAELDRTKLPLTRSPGHQKVVFDINPHVNDADELALHEYAQQSPTRMESAPSGLMGI